MLRILFLSNRGLVPIKDGHTRRSYNILKGLCEKNEVHFLSFYETPEEIEPRSINELKNFCHEVEFFPAPAKKLGIPMLARLLRSLFSREPYTIWRHYSKVFLKRVDELILSKGFDLVHCDILPLAYTIRKSSGIFRSITDHDVSYLKCLRMGQQASNILLRLFCYVESWKLKKLESEVFKEVDLGIVVSELDKKTLKELCPEGRFVVTENGVDVTEFKPDHHQGFGDRLIWVGGFDHYPNRQAVYHFLECIYPKIKDKLPEIQFDVVGGSVPPKLQRIASADQSIKLLGYVDNPLPYMLGASVFIVPVLSGGGTRLKVLEAMSAGKPIVSTTIGCEGLDGVDGKHYLIADDPDGFAEAAVQLLSSDSLRASIGSNAREFVEHHYDYRSICKKLNLVYEQALEDHLASQSRLREAR
jgi:glycosyltransferase involved in cell wall biosynthesis